MRLLLINPRFPESFWSFTWAINEVLPRKSTTCPPLGLARLAALCPHDGQVCIVDENVEEIPLDAEADIVGICGMGVQFQRQRERLTRYRGRGYYTVAGGSYASLCNEKYAPVSTTVMAGEAQYIWKELCFDFAYGEPKALYHATGTVACPIYPRRASTSCGLSAIRTRLCSFHCGRPFRCEFRDIIVLCGRKPRVKSHRQIGRKLDALRLAHCRHAQRILR